MSATSAPVTTTPPATPGPVAAASKVKKRLTSPWASLAAVVLAFLWTLPTFGLLVSSFRPRETINSTGWWTIFPHREQVTAQVIELPRSFADRTSISGDQKLGRPLAEVLAA